MKHPKHSWRLNFSIALSTVKATIRYFAWEQNDKTHSITHNENAKDELYTEDAHRKLITENDRSPSLKSWSSYERGNTRTYWTFNRDTIIVYLLRWQFDKGSNHVRNIQQLSSLEYTFFSNIQIQNFRNQHSKDNCRFSFTNIILIGFNFHEVDSLYVSPLNFTRLKKNIRRYSYDLRKIENFFWIQWNTP